MENQYDIIVIGSGPGGYTGAVRASQLGYRVAIIEKYNTLGGTCSNVGCIPAKALLDSTEHFHQAKEQFHAHGIELNGEPVLNFAQFIKRKNEVVASNVVGLQYLMKKNKIDVYNGLGSFIDNKSIKVTGTDMEKILTAKYFIIATGSKPSSIPGVVIDKDRIITSTVAMSLAKASTGKSVSALVKKPVAMAKPAAASKSIAAGKALYMQSCVACHLVDGGGVQNLNPPLITSYVLGAMLV
jgi:dihydrolipoamide dehydrogenase